MYTERPVQGYASLLAAAGLCLGQCQHPSLGGTLCHENHLRKGTELSVARHLIGFESSASDSNAAKKLCCREEGRGRGRHSDRERGDRVLTLPTLPFAPKAVAATDSKVVSPNLPPANLPSVDKLLPSSQREEKFITMAGLRKERVEPG
ncbi:hypothetical protein H8959_007931 [Pygathrix nigripes]